MRKLYWLVVLLFAVVPQGFSQNAFFAVANGNWNASGVWSYDGATPIVCAVCVPGLDYPGPIDQAYTQGFNISLPANSNFSVGDLYVAYNVALGITRPNLGVAPTLTIQGELAGYDPAIPDYATPTTNVIRSDNSTINLVFNGANASGPVINSWSTAAPLKVVRFNPALSSTTLSIPGLALSNNGAVTVQNGILQLDGNLRVATGATVASVTVNSGTTLLVNTGNINGDGTPGSLFPTIIINGTLTSVANSTSYVNSTFFTLGTGSTFNVGFNGANQTQGWWYQTNAPTSSTLHATSTVNYSSNTVQNVAAAITYGNLTLTSSSAAVKTLSGSGLIITGNLTVGANVTSSPASQVEFFGAATQTISGAGTLNFDGGLEVNKSAGTLTVNKAITITGGLTLTNGTLAMAGTSTISGGIAINAGTWNLGDVSTTIAGGVFTNAGIVTSGTSGTVTVSGSSTFSGTGSLALNNLTTTVTTGAATINNSAWSLTGNISNNGSITLPSSSTVTFTGGSAQSISGNALTIGNILINKSSSTLANNANVVLTGVLTVTTGTFDADGSGSGIFTLNSDTNGDARIGPMAGGSILGEVTFERYFNNITTGRWRNLAFPVTNVDYSELAASVPLQTGSVAFYTESALGNVDQGWTYLSSGTFNSTRGHSVRMYNVTPITVSVRGPLLRTVPADGVSPHDFGITYTNDPGQPASQDGWNFVPNPFASPIDWTNSGWVKTRVDAAAAIWDMQSNTYRYSNVDWDGIVAQGQAFWVHTNAASPLLTATEAVKEAVSDPVFYRRASEESRMMISLKSSLYTDKAALQFRDDATAEFDGDLDAFKLQNPVFNLSTLSADGLELAANTLPRTPCTSDVRLNITNIEPGTYTLKFEGLGSFNDLESVVLVDNFTNTSITLSGSATHAFEVTTDAGSYGSSRFELKFKFSEGSQPVPAIEAAQDVLVSKFEEGETYQWLLNGVPIEGAVQPSYRPVLNGLYSYEVGYKGCAIVSETITVEAKKRVFPNPVFEDLKIQVDNLIPNGVGSGEIVISSSLGEVVKRINFNSTELVKNVDMRDVRPGQYIVSISANSKIIERVKIIVQ